jgi:hypothetical protein
LYATQMEMLFEVGAHKIEQFFAKFRR